MQAGTIRHNVRGLVEEGRGAGGERHGRTNGCAEKWKRLQYKTTRNDETTSEKLNQAKAGHAEPNRV